MAVAPAGSGTLQGSIKRVRAFGPILRADVALPGGGDETLIEIDAPRDHNLKPGDLVGLRPRRYRIFAAQADQAKSRPGIGLAFFQFRPPL